MKQKFTERKCANRKSAGMPMSGIYSMSVAERRKRGLKAADSAVYDEKHGIAISSTPSSSKKRRAITRRQS